MNDRNVFIAKEIVHNFLYNYLQKENLDYLINSLSKDIQWLGNGSCINFDYEQSVSFLKLKFEDTTQQFSVSKENLSITRYTENLFLCSGNLTFTDNKNMSLDSSNTLIVSLLIEIIDGIAKIDYLHTTFNFNLARQNDYYVSKIIKENSMMVQRIANEHKQQLEASIENDKKREHIYLKTLESVFDFVFESEVKNGKILYETGNFHDAFGLPSHTKGLFYQTILSLADKCDCEQKEWLKEAFTAENFQKLSSQNNDILNYELSFTDSENRCRWITFSICLLKDNCGRLDRLIGCINDTTKKQAQVARIKQAAESDALTMVYNKKQIEYKIQEILQTNLESVHAFIMLDVDDFRNINTAYGHCMGDKALVKISELLKKYFAKNALIGRIGGDEFVVFMQDIKSKKHISKIIKNFIENVNQTYVENTRLSVSLGVALTPLGGSEFVDLYKKADKALYSSKNLGKNQFQYYI